MTVPGWSKVKTAFADFRRERDIRSVLLSIKRQQVISLDANRNAWIVRDEPSAVDDALKTCQLRAWIESIPQMAIEKNVADDLARPKVRIALYRLTDSGWNAIYFIHRWVEFTFFIALVTLFATIVGIVVSTHR